MARPEEDDDHRGFSVSLVPLNDDLDDEEKKVLRHELENITEQDLLDQDTESNEELHDLLRLKQKLQRRATTNVDGDKDSSAKLLLQEELKERRIQSKTKLSFFDQELVKEAIKHNLDDKEIVRRILRLKISGLNDIQRRQVLIFIFARHDFLEDPKHTPEESDKKFLKEVEHDIIRGRKELAKMEDDLRKLDDS